MTQFNITVGDWSKDDHGNTDNYIVEVPDDFTEEQIRKNYLKNVGQWGFSPEDFAHEYEDNKINIKWAQKLIHAGLDTAVFSDESEFDEDDDEWANAYVEGPEEMAKIAMFFISHGLENFEWKFVNPPMLFGSWETVCGQSIGHGLYR